MSAVSRAGDCARPVNTDGSQQARALGQGRDDPGSPGAKAGLFVSVGAYQRELGDDAVSRMPEATARLPLASFGIGLAAISLIGLPPSAAFGAKWLMLESAFSHGRWSTVAVIAAGSLLAAAYFFRMIQAGFVSAPPTLNAAGACFTGARDRRRPASPRVRSPWACSVSPSLNSHDPVPRSSARDNDEHIRASGGHCRFVGSAWRCPLVVHRGTPLVLRGGRVYLAYTLARGRRPPGRRRVSHCHDRWARFHARRIRERRHEQNGAHDAVHPDGRRPRREGGARPPSWVAARRNGRACTGQRLAAYRRRGESGGVRITLFFCAGNFAETHDIHYVSEIARPFTAGQFHHRHPVGSHARLRTRLSPT